MGITNDRNDPALKNIDSKGMQEKYLTLSPEETAKGFVRPLYTTYKHVGKRPKYPTRPLTDDEALLFEDAGFIVFEEYPKEARGTGRFWTRSELESGCGEVTSIHREIAATYARKPGFYTATYCCECQTHIDLNEFVWVTPDGTVTDIQVGT